MVIRIFMYGLRPCFPILESLTNFYCTPQDFQGLERADGELVKYCKICLYFRYTKKCMGQKGKRETLQIII